MNPLTFKMCFVILHTSVFMFYKAKKKKILRCLKHTICVMLVINYVDDQRKNSFFILDTLNFTKKYLFFNVNNNRNNHTVAR